MLTTRRRSTVFTRLPHRHKCLCYLCAFVFIRGLFYCTGTMMPDADVLPPIATVTGWLPGVRLEGTCTLI